MTSNMPTTAAGRRAYPTTEKKIRKRRRAGASAATLSAISYSTRRKQQIRMIQKNRSTTSFAFFRAFSFIP